MFNEKIVSLLTEIPLSILNTVDAPTLSNDDDKCVQPKSLLKYVKDGNLDHIKGLFDSNAALYKTKTYLEASDEVRRIKIIFSLNQHLSL